jgi:AcrR family transcriptional regulator
VSPTQATRTAKARDSLLESAAQKLSRYGYANLVLEHVAAEAGYTRGAVYHHFEDKQELALAVLSRESDAWVRQVGALADEETDPMAALIGLVRAHASHLQREGARVGMAMRIEFGPRDHPVGRAADESFTALVERCARLITTARLRGSVPSGPPARALARALIGAVEGASVELAGRSDCERIAENVARGVLGLGSAGK